MSDGGMTSNEELAEQSGMTTYIEGDVIKDGRTLRTEITTNYGDVLLMVFAGDPDLGVRPGGVQAHFNGEWDEKNNWTPSELRNLAAAANRAADLAEGAGAVMAKGASLEL